LLVLAPFGCEVTEIGRLPLRLLKVMTPKRVWSAAEYASVPVAITRPIEVRLPETEVRRIGVPLGREPTAERPVQGEMGMRGRALDDHGWRGMSGGRRQQDFAPRGINTGIVRLLEVAMHLAPRWEDSLVYFPIYVDKSSS
jgi:hypothetical protein